MPATSGLNVLAGLRASGAVPADGFLGTLVPPPADMADGFLPALVNICF